MGEVELGLQVESNRHVLEAVFRLPPVQRSVFVVLGDDVLDAVAVFVRLPGLPGETAVTGEALHFVFQMGNDTVAFGSAEPASRRGREEMPASDQQVPRGRVAAPVRALVFVFEGGVALHYCWKTLLFLRCEEDGGEQEEEEEEEGNLNLGSLLLLDASDSKWWSGREAAATAVHHCCCCCPRVVDSAASFAEGSFGRRRQNCGCRKLRWRTRNAAGRRLFSRGKCHLVVVFVFAVAIIIRRRRIGTFWKSSSSIRSRSRAGDHHRGGPWVRGVFAGPFCCWGFRPLLNKKKLGDGAKSAKN